MRFRGPRIEASRELESREDFVFRCSAHHVREIFFRRAELVDSTYVVRNHLGRERLRFDCRHLR